MQNMEDIDGVVFHSVATTSSRVLFAMNALLEEIIMKNKIK